MIVASRTLVLGATKHALPCHRPSPPFFAHLHETWEGHNKHLIVAAVESRCPVGWTSDFDFPAFAIA